MKKLVVMRHAQAGSAAADFDRPLTAHGIEQAKEAAHELKQWISPQLVLVSDAQRTRMTAQQCKEVLDLSEELFCFDNRIYEASLLDLTYRLKEIPAETDEVLFIGHNPGVSMLIASLTRSGVGFPPGAFAVVELEADNWLLSNGGKTTLKHYFCPS